MPWKVPVRKFNRSPDLGYFERPSLMKQSLPSLRGLTAVPTLLLTIGLLLSIDGSHAQDNMQDGGALAGDSSTIDVDRIPDQMDERILGTRTRSKVDDLVPEDQAHSIDHPPMHDKEIPHTDHHRIDSEVSYPPSKDTTADKNHDVKASAGIDGQLDEEPGTDATTTEGVVGDDIDAQETRTLEVGPNHQATINQEHAEEDHKESSGIPREAQMSQEAARTPEDLPLTEPPNDDDGDSTENEAIHTKDSEKSNKRTESSRNQEEIEGEADSESSAERPGALETKQEENMRATEALIDTIEKEGPIESGATDGSENENALPLESLSSKRKLEIEDDLVIEDTNESELLRVVANKEEAETQPESETVSTKTNTSGEIPPDQIRTEPQSTHNDSGDSSTGPATVSIQEKEHNGNESATLYCGVWGTFRSERSYADLRILHLLFQGLDQDEMNATDYLSYLASSESGKLDLPSEEDILGGTPAEESVNEDPIDGSSFRKTTNTQFVEGLDDIDKFFEGIDPPDELDVAPGSSMQEVIMGQGTRIVLKRLSMGFRAVKNAFVETKQKVIEAKNTLLERIHTDQGLHFPFNTDDVARVLENIRGTIVRASGAVRGAVENAFEDDGVARRIWRFAVDAVRTAQSTIDDILEGGEGEAEEELQEMASKLRQTQMPTDVLVEH